MNKRIKKKYKSSNVGYDVKLSEYQKQCYYCTSRSFCIYGLDKGVATSSRCTSPRGKGGKYYFSNYLYEKSRG